MSDYSKMSDSDLTKAVAERLGWQFRRTTSADPMFSGGTDVIAPDGTRLRTISASRAIMTTVIHASSPILPNYSTSIADAWTLCYQIDEHHRPLIIGEVYQGYEPVGWRVDLVRFGENRGSTSFEATTAPRAICIAFLMAHDSDVERGAVAIDTPQGEKKQEVEGE